ncbi:protein of unknown function [Bradyrhizobium vignae]|uniref:Uncharacterized protein n=1 Tax=Bradyrhizobium vignae TaxID=1549949 RepID=A0A2U3Q6X0_9BRAD|nr:protein of unknown function [Bradyrhizobium vignae]
MARKLSLEFYNHAIAAPSLKVTLEACDVQSGWMISDRAPDASKGLVARVIGSMGQGMGRQTATFVR